ncbi:hypothetical protein [Citrobacter sp.]|uniref:hypothetical protein n=1 Tax=Citrobacter sp. TaxID=1896336 RepID=UPI00290468C9|nr:hypothetical protein [Citrobacter sp.]MDU1874712.1 hypothetical protein [Citrobacter sp.]
MSEHQPFEAMKQFDDKGAEFWSARELAPLLEYKEWRNFQKVIMKATVSCESSVQLVANHFVEANKMVELGSGASRTLEDIHLSRYACYLVETAQLAGVETAFDFAIFQNHGYRGLYGGLDQRAIHELGGTMPEALPLPEKSIQQLQIDVKKNTK